MSTIKVLVILMQAVQILVSCLIGESHLRSLNLLISKIFKNIRQIMAKHQLSTQINKEWPPQAHNHFEIKTFNKIQV